MTIKHAFTSPIADATGTVTIWDGATTASAIASQLVRPGDWNAVHVGGLDMAVSNTTYTSGTIVLSGGANVTIGTNGQTVTVSAQSQSVQTQNLVAISASNNLFSSGTVVMSGLGAAVVNTAAGSIRISVPVQTAETAISGLANSETTYTSGSVTLSALANITIRSTTGQHFQFSVANQSAQTQSNIAGLGNSETTYQTGTVNLSVVGGNLTIRSTTGQAFQFSASQTVQTQSLIAAVYDGANSISTGTVRFTNANGVSFSVNGQTMSGSVAAGATATGNLGGIAVNALTTYTSGTVVLSAGNNITLGTNAQTVTISGVAAQTVQTQNIMNVSINGNSTSGGAGYALVSSGTLTLAGGPNITLSQDGNHISISGGAGGAGGSFSAGVSNLGNTAGSTGVSGTRLVFVGSGEMSLSQSTDANGATISILEGPIMSSFDAYPMVMVRTAVIAQATLQMRPWQVMRAYQHDRVIIPLAYSQATNSTLTVSISAWFGLYTRNASTLSLASSASGSFSINGSGTVSSASYSGTRVLSLGWTNTVPASDYWLANVFRTSTAGADASLSHMEISILNTNWSGYLGAAANASFQSMLGLATYSVTTSGMPNSIGFSEMTGSGSLAHRPPQLYFLSQTV